VSEFCVLGDYFKVRHFTSDLLTQLHAFTLDAVQFQKPIGGGALETHIALSCNVAS
jgi:hypothetical protein